MGGGYSNPYGERPMLSAKELQEKVLNFAESYFLCDAHHDRESFYSLTPEDLAQYPVASSGIFLNLVMDGELDKAKEWIDRYPKDSFMYMAHYLVFPKITWTEFISIINECEKRNVNIPHVMLTAGRPSILNGVNDFTRLAPHLERHKEKVLRGLQVLYPSECGPFIYKLCLAEYYYQKNDLIDAEILLCQTIKEFDKNNERRFLFVALYLQSKIMLAHGKNVDTDSYIKNIRDFVKENGRAEFFYNIDALQVHFSLYNGNFDIINEWLKTDAPDEFADFNMLDVYRYMVKMRIYIVKKNYSAVIGLAAKLRPLLEEGYHHMDLCELALLVSMAFYKSGKKDLALDYLGRALKVVRRRKYYRLVADEGELMLNLLIEYVKENGSTPFLQELIDMTRSMAAAHPLYMKIQNKLGEQFTQMEIDILKFLEHGKSKEEIAEYFFITVNTVKYHMKKIYSKLDVSSAHQAVWEARVLGLI